MARGPWLSSVFAAGLGLAAVASTEACAQVLSIGDDGAVTTYAGPAVYTTEGATVIAPPEPAQFFRAAPEQVVQFIRESSARHAVPASIVEAVAWQESRFNHAAVSSKGARGVMQLLPTTASDLGVDPSDLRGNIDGGAAYLAQQLRRFGDVKLALAAYNAGPKAVERYGGVPPYAETQSYVRAIMARLAAASAVGAGAQ
ncbi:MAG: lytic transglycosylase domain-containing protein [Alphaproteobacteria bacterium]|nr:lytic transglycosylase domain-containing protein [Alphaproteobacteria bacterium]MBU1516823.1 lytic transglycosylase domain-containing protein [Alphaproteobacteria bacterium]MBU2092517.1 lytic transglycosylase domain-containing protein [Alphaproteobacteria bacterium]MBU2151371.1 lytic transglycosylase domain-containing protein [Alphaproteobacteria bacterium]MBU2309674.1 lytic transglycosylase domain-containing protein [Alphaproteobacteria bacterium]